MVSEIQSIKLAFIQEYLRINDETIINKLSDILHEEKSKKLRSESLQQKKILRQMTEEELIVKLNKSENDISEGKVMSQFEIKEYFNIK